MKAWNNETNGKIYTHDDIQYNINNPLSNGMSITQFAARETTGGNKSLVVCSRLISRR